MFVYAIVYTMLSFDPPYAPHFDYKVFAKEKERFLGNENTIHTKEEIEKMVQNWKGKTPRILQEHTTKKTKKYTPLHTLESYTIAIQMDTYDSSFSSTKKMFL